MTSESNPVVQIRTPTYRRPDALRRCLGSLQAQTWPHWHCDVYDDCPDRSGEAVCRGFEDPRITYHHNRPQRFASKNIDGCFSDENPRGADYFCVVEDDNRLLPAFLEENIALCVRSGCAVVLRNQLVEFASGTEAAEMSTFGIFDEAFVEGAYPPALFRLSLIAGIGVSNGALFWSRRARSRLEIGYACSATLQEYMRTFSIAEPLYVAMKPLAVWAQNGTETTRDLGDRAGYLRRELDLKRGIQTLQRAAWRESGDDDRRRFLAGEAFAYRSDVRSRGLAKALIHARAGDRLPLRERARLTARGVLIRSVGRLDPSFGEFVHSRILPRETRRSSVLQETAG